MLNHHEARTLALAGAKKWLVWAGTGIAWALLYILLKLKHYQTTPVPILGWPWPSVVAAILSFSFVVQMVGLVRLRSIVPGAALEVVVEAISETLNVLFFNLPAGRPVRWAYEWLANYWSRRDDSAMFYEDPPDRWEQIYHEDRQAFYPFTVNHKSSQVIPHRVIFDNTRMSLPLDCIFLRWDQETEWAVSADLQSRTVQASEAYQKWARRHDKNLHDGVHLRLCGLLSDPDRLTLTVQKVSYFDSFRSNNVCDYPLSPGAETLRHKSAPNGQMESLDTSNMANLFGVNHLIISSDGYVVVVERSSKVAIRPGYFTPSAAGDFDYDDFGPPSATVTAFSAHSVTREVAAELGTSVVQSLSEHVLLGIAREVARCGKPDSFFAANSAMTFTQIEESWRRVRDRWEGARLHAIHLGEPARCQSISFVDAYRIMRSLEDFAKTFQSKISVTLAMNIEFWIRYKLTHIA